MGDKKQSMKKFLFFLLISTALACGVDSKKTAPKKATIEVPAFSSDSAYVYIEKQVAFGYRYISSPGWNLCGDYLVNELSKYTPHVQEQNNRFTTYDGKSHNLRNIIAAFSPEKNNRVLLCAHWDTRHVADHDTINQDQPILGANDGGSGVAVLLEIARNLAIKDSKIGVDIILFDAEDYGQPSDDSNPTVMDSWCIGSQYWSKNPHVENYYARYGILLDMVGGKNATFTHEELSRFYAPNILNKVWKTAHTLGFDSYFKYEPTPQILDDHYYVNSIANIPTIDIIEYDHRTASGFYKHWHTHQDNMSHIDKSTLKAVGQTVMNVIYNE